MTTHERELLEPVDLCTPDGNRLNPAARRCSRRPLHRANLGGERGRNKRWDYWAVLAGDLVVSLVYADVDDVGVQFGAKWTEGTGFTENGFIVDGRLNKIGGSWIGSTTGRSDGAVARPRPRRPTRRRTDPALRRAQQSGPKFVCAKERDVPAHAHRA